MVHSKASVRAALDNRCVVDPLPKNRPGVGGGRKLRIYTESRRGAEADAISGSGSKSPSDVCMPPRQRSTMARKSSCQTAPKDAKIGDENAPKSKVAQAPGRTTRKALTDISNARHSNSLSKGAFDGSKPMSYKTAGLTSSQCVSTKPALRTIGALTRKLYTGKEEQGTCGPSKAIRTTKISFVVAGDKRKSSLVPKRSSQVNSKGLQKVEIKTRVSSEIQLKASNTARRNTRNRTSDGCITAPKGKPLSGAALGSSFTQIKKTVAIGLNAKRITQSKPSVLLEKPFPETKADTAKCEEEPIPLPRCKSTEDPDGENISASISCVENIPDNNAKKKPKRRRSYTSSLMARSKFLSDHGEVFMEEKLPDIDDCTNQLEVAEYVDEIYEYYWTMEVQSTSLRNYMSIQNEIAAPMRGILINWLIEVHFKFDLMHETLYLMVALLDQYLSRIAIPKNEMQLVGLASLLLASKYEDFWHPRINDLISISAESYTRRQLLSMEKSMLKELKFRLNVPTSYVFMLRFLKAARADKTLEHLSFYLVELCLVEYEALEFKPSLLCASAIYVARCTLQMSPPWTPLLMRHTRYEPAQIRDCAETVLRVHKAARSRVLKVTCDKYMGTEFGKAAALKPLDMLPR
ncbi:hypothetical protein MLD38_016869 [Melastoma candidum]|uniref:Uncharacterized protein n=1 Tax=Melastoma candidum TaxID=119954 RepID=A0ACB9QNU0_9MYRT|nr:hypothetical protein MLD38_016869 [Melastoma candidum]